MPVRASIRAARGFAVLGAALLLAACGQREETAEKPVDPEALAVVNGTVITEQMLLDEVERRRQAGRPAGDRETLLQDLVEREAMLQAARESEALDEPDAQRAVENALLAEWLERTLRKEKDAVTLTEEELRTAYEERIDQFTRPPMTRLAILYREADEHSSPETIESLSRELEEARRVFLEDRDAALQDGRMKGFGSVAARYSEDAASRYRGGDIGWIDESRDGYRWPPDLLQTGYDLEIGEVSDVILTRQGLYVVMKIAERDAEVTPFADAVPALRRQLLTTRQEAAEQEFLSRLLSERDVEIFSDRLDEVDLPLPDAVSSRSEPPEMMPRDLVEPRNRAN